MVEEDNQLYAAWALSKGGTTDLRRGARAANSECLTTDTLACGNRDSKSARVPVTKGAATLVPLEAMVCPPALRLTTSWPGAPIPLVPIECPIFDICMGRLSES